MRQAIVTKYLGPTNSRGSRVKATAAAGSITVHWDHALNSDDNHHAAAVALANRYGWLDPGRSGGPLPLIGGGLPDNSGNCYVFDDDRPPVRFTETWKDIAIDALMTDRYDRMMALIAIEGGVDLSTVQPRRQDLDTDPDKRLYEKVFAEGIEWDVEGQTVTMDGDEAFDVARAGETVGGRYKLSPHQVDVLRRRIADALNRGAI